MKRRSLSPRRTSPGAMLGLVLLAGALALGSVVPASAGSSSVRTGSCTGSANWRLTVEDNRRTLSVAFKVTGGPPRHRWTVFLDNDGWGFFSGSRRAKPNGALVVRKATSDRPGADRITAAATDRATGETCSGRVIVG